MRGSDGRSIFLNLPIDGKVVSLLNIYALNLDDKEFFNEKFS